MGRLLGACAYGVTGIWRVPKGTGRDTAFRLASLRKDQCPGGVLAGVISTSTFACAPPYYPAITSLKQRRRPIAKDGSPARVNVYSEHSQRL